ncbi:hypothetical protein [Sporolactobacillus pectinivorans]|uniref:hypothetical protein n=1 Tax=Sporolactobacillus pectinivorans TaxID=1591408 RepID=UPI000C25D69E|nr:hypothetical protein [Sporolactobacillus pectinivorans]
MKKFLKVITAVVLSLSILSGISFTPHGIAQTQNTAYAKITPLRVTSTHLTVRRGQYAYFTVEGKRSSEGYATVYYKVR